MLSFVKICSKLLRVGHLIILRVELITLFRPKKSFMGFENVHSRLHYSYEEFQVKLIDLVWYVT